MSDVEEPRLPGELRVPLTPRGAKRSYSIPPFLAEEPARKPSSSHFFFIELLRKKWEEEEEAGVFFFWSEWHPSVVVSAFEKLLNIVTALNNYILLDELVPPAFKPLALLAVDAVVAVLAWIHPAPHRSPEDGGPGPFLVAARTPRGWIGTELDKIGGHIVFVPPTFLSHVRLDDDVIRVFLSDATPCPIDIAVKIFYPDAVKVRLDPQIGARVQAAYFTFSWPKTDFFSE